MRLTTNAGKSVTSSNASDAFGVASLTANTASAFSWNAKSGYRQDAVAATGLPSAYSFQKVGDRYYDPTLGCFLTRDTELDQLPYTYCNGDPVNCTDPSGHKTKKQPGQSDGGTGSGGAGGGGTGGNAGGGGGIGSGSGGGNASPTTIPTGSGTVTVTPNSNGSVTLTYSQGNGSVAVTIGADGSISTMASENLTLGGGLSINGGQGIGSNGAGSGNLGLAYNSGNFSASVYGDSSGGWGLKGGLNFKF